MQKLPSLLLFHDLLDQYWREFVICIGFWFVDMPLVQISVGWADIYIYSMCLFHLSWWQDLTWSLSTGIINCEFHFAPSLKLLNGLNACSGHMLLSIDWEIVFNESTASLSYILSCVTRHGVCIDNWIYWMHITRNYRWCNSLYTL
jgi:hypothetical protein